MVPESSAQAADAVVRQVEAQLAEARAALDGWDGDAQLATDTP
jgi:hypothetical protein